MKNINIVITEDNAFAVSDWNVGKWYESLASGTTVQVATSVMLNELRIGVRLGEIEPFTFEFDGEVINCLPSGELDKWPNGLGDHVIIQMDVLLQGITREKAKENQYNAV